MVITPTPLARRAAGLLDRLPYRFGFLVRDVEDHIRVRGASQVRQSLIDRRHADRIRRLHLEGDDFHYTGGQENTREYAVRKLLLHAGPNDSLRNSLGPARRLGLISVLEVGECLPVGTARVCGGIDVKCRSIP